MIYICFTFILKNLGLNFIWILELKSALAERNIKNDGRLVTTPAGDADTGDHSVLYVFLKFV